MTPTATNVRLDLLELLDGIDRLRALHRAAESPTFGQVEALFDQADVVRRGLIALGSKGRGQERAPWPTPDPQPGRATEKAARRLVELVLAELTHPEAGR